MTIILIILMTIVIKIPIMDTEKFAAKKTKIKKSNQANAIKQSS